MLQGKLRSLFFNFISELIGPFYIYLRWKELRDKKMRRYELTLGYYELNVNSLDNGNPYIWVHS
jgi:hypothetical protein